MKRYRIIVHSYYYILERLRFAPANLRALRQHMRRRTDFTDMVVALIKRKKIFAAGSGKKGDPYMLYHADHYILPENSVETSLRIVSPKLDP